MLALLVFTGVKNVSLFFIEFIEFGYGCGCVLFMEYVGYNGDTLIT